MNTVTNGQNPSVNDPAPRNPSKDEAARSTQMDTAREAPTRETTTRETPTREASVSSRREVPRQEPSRDEARANVAASEKGARPAIPMGTDNASDKPSTDGEQLAPLFAQNVATDYRERWVIVQQGFIDDPRRAVQQGDELVTQVMKNLADTFSQERTALEGKLSESQNASTEMLRVALRRYRSFFERLLSF